MFGQIESENDIVFSCFTPLCRVHVLSTKDQRCFTPEGAVGQCIKLVECVPLLTILKKVQRNPQDTQFLQQSQCDRVGSSIYVCCRIVNQQLLPTTRECGNSFDNRIYGGNVTRIDEYPWLALVEYTRPDNEKDFFCGASLINKRYVITAAHCVTGNYIPADWRPTGIRLGEWDRSTTWDCQKYANNRLDCAEPHLDIAIADIIYHPSYDSRRRNHLHDIALVRLSRNVVFTDFISPVCLPVQTHMRAKTFDALKLDITGFGATEEGIDSNIKLKAGIDGWNFEKCRQRYAGRRIYLEDSQMCAGGQVGIDSCGGDSGGPLVIKQNLNNREVYVLAGIVSFGHRQCASSGWPGVYTRVGAYIDWIVDNIKDQACQTPNNLMGTCVNILQCPPLLDVLKNVQRTPQQTEFLQKSQCDYVDSKVYVCCSLESDSRFFNPSGSTLLPSTRECGKSFENRIYGGNVTKIDEYPWLALIEYTKPGNTKGFHCGAALISQRYVITAAHCVTASGLPVDWKPTGIRLGEWDRSTTRDCEISTNNREDCADPHLDIAIEEITIHPSYNSRDPNHLYDIALIRLNRNVAYTDFVSPVCLPVQTQLRSKTFDALKLDVSGFGATESGSSSAIKLKATVEAWNIEACRQKYSPKKVHLQDSQMCAGGQVGVDSCSGDSGGPLMIKQKVENRDVYVLAGIVSFGPKPCGLPGWPGVYTRVGAYVDWVVNNLKA